MTENLPDPLVPKEVDLRGLSFMPLDTVRLMDSDLFAISTGDEFKAAVALWCKSWTQVPAASIPNNDRVLAHLSGAGPNWGSVKEIALHGWILCSDNRWHHPVVAEKAKEAWKARISQRERANKRWGKQENACGNVSTIPDEHATAMPRQCHGNSEEYATAMQGTGTGTGKRDLVGLNDLEERGKVNPLPQSAPSREKSASPRPATAEKINLDLRTWQWSGITPQHNALWAEAYPAVDIRSELASAAAWIKANPTRKKSNWENFITSWLKRCQDRGGSSPAMSRYPGNSGSNKTVADQAKELFAQRNGNVIEGVCHESK